MAEPNTQTTQATGFWNTLTVNAVLNVSTLPTAAYALLYSQKTAQSAATSAALANDRETGQAPVSFLVRQTFAKGFGAKLFPFKVIFELFANPLDKRQITDIITA